MNRALGIYKVKYPLHEAPSQQSVPQWVWHEQEQWMHRPAKYSILS